jgi:hypothetical protein
VHREGRNRSEWVFFTSCVLTQDLSRLLRSKCHRILARHFGASRHSLRNCRMADFIGSKEMDGLISVFLLVRFGMLMKYASLITIVFAVSTLLFAQNTKTQKRRKPALASCF